MKIAVAVVVVAFGKSVYVGSVSVNPAYWAAVVLLTLVTLLLVAMFHYRDIT